MVVSFVMAAACGLRQVTVAGEAAGAEGIEGGLQLAVQCVRWDFRVRRCLLKITCIRQDRALLLLKLRRHKMQEAGKIDDQLLSVVKMVSEMRENRHV